MLYYSTDNITQTYDITIPENLAKYHLLSTLPIRLK